jgi:hypothetical protein
MKTFNMNVIQGMHNIMTVTCQVGMRYPYRSMITEPAFALVPILCCAESVITLYLIFVTYWLLLSWLYLN